MQGIYWKLWNEIICRYLESQWSPCWFTIWGSSRLRKALKCHAPLRKHLGREATHTGRDQDVVFDKGIKPPGLWVVNCSESIIGRIHNWSAYKVCFDLIHTSLGRSFSTALTLHQILISCLHIPVVLHAYVSQHRCFVFQLCADENLWHSFHKIWRKHV